MEKHSIKTNMPGNARLSPGELKSTTRITRDAAGEPGKPTKLKYGPLLLWPVALFLIILSGCSKQQADMKATDPNVRADVLVLNTDEEFKKAYQNDIQSQDSKPGLNQRTSSHGFSFITLLELLEARLATAKYRDFDKAIKDGYADINVVVPNMGYHFMKSAIVDATFQATKPEILVYNKKANGSFELVAVEYAVPISATPYVAPEGFTGSADEWERNEDFGLWLQHAWLWRFNPDGIFHDTNPTVQVR